MKLVKNHKSPEQIKANLSEREHDGRKPNLVASAGSGDNVVANWHPQEGKPGLLVVQGVGLPTRESIARQIRFAARLDKSSGGLLSYLGVRARPTRLETPLRPWEDSCFYVDPELFVDNRDKLDARMPAGHRMPRLELIGERHYSSEEYAAARARGAFLLARGAYANHDLIAHAVVQALVSEGTNKAHGKQVAAYVDQAQIGLAETGDETAYKEIMGRMMLHSDTGFSGAGIAEEWPDKPTNYGDAIYMIVTGVDADRARELAVADREHVAFLSSVALGSR